MKQALRELDRVLRGETTRPENIEQGLGATPVFGIALLGCALGAAYGFFMGVYGLTVHPERAPLPLLATMLKVPLLFILTLLITFPSLYVFNTLLGSRLSLATLARLLTVALAVMLTVLASFGPITAFFSVSTSSYHFMSLLNLFFFAIAGLLGATFLRQTLHRCDVAYLYRVRSRPAPQNEQDPESTPGKVPPGPLDRLEGHLLGDHVRKVFAIWICLFGVVGGQMSWVLRPFIGDPSLPFAWFRPRQSNFFEAVWQVLTGLLRSAALARPGSGPDGSSTKSSRGRRWIITIAPVPFGAPARS